MKRRKMNASEWFFWIVSVPCFSFSIVEENQIQILVDPFSGNDTSCLANFSVPCRTLGHAFTYKANYTTYKLSSDAEHILNDSVNLEFTYHTNLSLIGTNSTILCQGDVGLAFIYMTNLYFEGITFQNCSAIRNSTSKYYNSTDPKFILYPFKVGLYFDFCRNLAMTKVTVAFSPGATGMVMYDVGGMVTIEGCIFRNNTVQEEEIGGGGLYIEFTYCRPGDQECVDDHPYSNISNTVITISDSTFLDNIADNQDKFSNATYIVPYQSNHQAFGRGGGLSIFVNGIASSNNISVINCHFEGNKAQWGGGAFVEFHDQADNNNVVFSNCSFMNNKCEYNLQHGTGGGGMRIGHYVYGFRDYTNDNKGNRIELTGCNFTSNSAMYGGGLSVSPTLRNTGGEKFIPATLKLSDMYFQNNTAKIGAAIHLERFALLTNGKMVHVQLQNCAFLYNTATYAEYLGLQDSPHPVGIGTVYINQVSTVFLGSNYFYKNNGTALAVIGAHVNFSSSNTLFSLNSGYRGGAVSLLGAAYLIIDNSTEVVFSSNSAQDVGGAIYNRYVEMDNLKTRTNCFIRHVNPFLSPNDWNAKFTFINNTDQNGKRNNSIHTTSALPCYWAGGDGYSDSGDIIFCWVNWTHCTTNDISDLHCDNSSACSEYISSAPGNISDSSNISAFPGWKFNLDLDVTDDYYNNVSVVYKATQISGENDVDSYIWNNIGTIRGSENSNSHLSLDIVGDRVWEARVNVELLPCPPGFHFSYDTCVCGNDNDQANNESNDQAYYAGDVHCIFNSQLALLQEQHWMGKIGDHSNYLVGFCPPGFCKMSHTSHIELPHDHNSLQEKVCSKNRQDILCGECWDGYGPAINSRTFECIECTNTSRSRNIIKYMALVYLPLTIFFSALIVFDIRLTTGPANAFILFCQVITSTLDIGYDGAISIHTKVRGSMTLTDIYRFVYGIFNLEFFENLVPNVCVSPNFNALTVLALDYGVAIYPLLIIIFIVICVKLKSLCACKSNAQASRAVQAFCKWRSKPITESFLPAFAAFILLSYTKFSLTSSYILEKQYVFEEDGNPHYPARVYYAGQFDVHNSTYVSTYYLPSVVVLALVFIIPIMLLVYPLMLFEWCLFKVYFLWKLYPVDKIHFFLDNFQGCYKNKMRFFAGLYFLFRLTVNVAYLASTSWQMQFIIQQVACILMLMLVSLCQPYNKENSMFNIVDSLIFTNMLILNSLTFYLYSASSSSDEPVLQVFVVMYILVLLPLLYMVGYILWFFLRKSRKIHNLLKKVSRMLNKFLQLKYVSRNLNSINSTANERTNLLHNDDELFERAEGTNQYRRVETKEVKVTEVRLDSGETSEHYENSNIKSAEMNRVSATKSSNNSAGYGSYGGTISSARSTTS